MWPKNEKPLIRVKKSFSVLEFQTGFRRRSSIFYFFQMIVTFETVKDIHFEARSWCFCKTLRKTITMTNCQLPAITGKVLLWNLNWSESAMLSQINRLFIWTHSEKGILTIFWTELRWCVNLRQTQTTWGSPHSATKVVPVLATHPVHQSHQTLFFSSHKTAFAICRIHL